MVSEIVAKLFCARLRWRKRVKCPSFSSFSRGFPRHARSNAKEWLACGVPGFNERFKDDPLVVPPGTKFSYVFILITQWIAYRVAVAPAGKIGRKVWPQ